MKMHLRFLAPKLVPWLLGLLAMAIYAYWAIPDVVYGLPVHLLNLIRGDYYLSTSLHGIYLGIAELATRIPAIPNLTLLNGISIVTGAGVMVLFFFIARRAPAYDKIDWDQRHHRLDMRAITVGAAVSALLLATCPPVLRASTRPDFHNLDFILLMTPFVIAMRFNEGKTPRLYLLYIATILYGLGCSEFPLMLCAIPLFAALLMFFLFQRQILTPTILGRLATLGLLSIVISYAISVTRMRLSPTFEFGEFSSAQMILHDMLVKQWREIKSSFPQFGILLIMLTALAPFLFVLFIPKPVRPVEIVRRWYLSLSLLALNLLGGFILLGVWITPEHILGTAPTLTLTYMIIASWVGYLTGYWLYILLLRSHAPILRVISALLFIANVAYPAVLLYRNAQALREGEQPQLMNYAKDVVESARDRGILLVPPLPVDDLLRCAARDAGTPGIIIRVTDLARPSYRAYLAQRLGNPNLWSGGSTASQIDILRTLVTSVGMNQCSFYNKEHIMILGLQPVPVGLTFQPTENFDQLPPLPLFQRNMIYFEGSFTPNIDYLKAHTNAVAQTYLLKEYSRCANELGASMRVLKRDDLAEKAFLLAENIFEDNSSALLNLHHIYRQQATMTASADATQKASAYLDKAYEASRRIGDSYKDPVALIQTFGAVVSEEATVMMADRYRQMGLLAPAGSLLQQALWINPKSPAVIGSVAAFSIAQGNVNQGVRGYETVLQAEPTNMNARVQLASVYHATRNYDLALRTLRAAPDAAQNAQNNALQALINIDKGATDQGILHYEKAAALIGTNTLPTATTLAMAAIRLNKLEDAEYYASRAMAASTNSSVALLQAEVSLRRNRPDEYIERLKKAAQLAPDPEPILERLVAVAINQNRKGEARNAAYQLLNKDPANMIANLALYTLTTSKDLRIDFLRKACENTSHPFYPVTLHELASELIKAERVGDALPLADRAATLNPADDKVRHTLAFALLNANRFDAAAEQIRMAMALAPDNPLHQLLYAEIRLAQGHRDEARELLSSAMPRLQEGYRERALQLMEKL